MTRYRGRGNRYSYVYVIRHEHGFCKIGKANSPENRKSSMQTASPYRLYLFTTIAVAGEPKLVESTLHDVYSEYHVRGEWFELPDSVLHDLADIDEIHSSEIERVAEWTPKKHLELSGTELVELRESAAEKHLIEAQSMIESGNFPKDGIDENNPAIKKWAAKSDAHPRVFAELLKDRCREVVVE